VQKRSYEFGGACKAETDGACSGDAAREALQPPDGGSLYGMDTPVHCLPREAASVDDVRGGGQCLPETLGVRKERLCLHAKPGTVRSAFSVRSGAGREAGLGPDGNSGQAAGTVAGRSDAGALPRWRRRTACVIRLRRICWRGDTTFGPYKNCSATRTSRLR